MILHTASEVISLARELESKSAAFYEALSRDYPEKSEVFLSFAKEGGKDIPRIERSYYGTITDAIEGCFVFDLDSEAYLLKTEAAGNATPEGAVSLALGVEQVMTRFYADAAEQSESLMADLSRALARTAEKRNDRSLQLKTLL